MGDRLAPDPQSSASSSSSSTITEPHLLFVALADSYLNTAHSTGIKESFDSDLYQTLVTAAIRCLEAALYEFKLQPKFEAALRLRYASVLEEETENVTDAEQILHKGILIAGKVEPTQ
ncbi:hypothetical protein AA313_de0201935 [Arthrobotrys entomopaga]|nr:hypothetical protein AA313_de0201935 [Arthrobotrys entomopaga]